MQPNKVFNCAAGMERLYYHTTTWLPIYPSEIDYDSDDDLVPNWLEEQTVELISDFTDVNEGEKGIMRLWNLFIMKNNIISNSQVYGTCERFIEENGADIIRLKLKHNFALHLSNLIDFGQLTPAQQISLWRKLMSSCRTLIE